MKQQSILKSKISETCSFSGKEHGLECECFFGSFNHYVLLLIFTGSLCCTFYGFLIS